ncbi:protein of unknown function [Burkholderia multivorans]
MGRAPAGQAIVTRADSPRRLAKRIPARAGAARIHDRGDGQRRRVAPEDWQPVVRRRRDGVSDDADANEKARLLGGRRRASPRGREDDLRMMRLATLRQAIARSSVGGCRLRVNVAYRKKRFRILI